MEQETWRSVPGFEGYEVSDRGRVRGPKKLLNPSADSGGNIYVSLRNKSFGIARLVLLAFAGEPPTPKHKAYHINGDRTDNRLGNLRWATHSEIIKKGKQHARGH